MRKSGDLYNGKGQLVAGYDYEHQAWVENCRYLDCGHPKAMACGCYGRLHAGEETKPSK